MGAIFYPPNKIPFKLILYKLQIQKDRISIEIVITDLPCLTIISRKI